MISSSQLLLSLLIPLVAFLIHAFFRPRPFKAIPTLPARWLTGHALDLLRHLKQHQTIHPFYEHFADECGQELSQVLFLYNFPALVTGDQNQIDHVVSSKDWDKAGTLADIVENTIPLAMFGRKTDDLVRNHRRVLAATNSPAFLALAGASVSAHLSLLWARWRSKIHDPATGDTEQIYFDAAHDLKHLATDTISELSFGESFRQLETGEDHPVATSMTFLFNTISAGMGVKVRNFIVRRSAPFRSNMASFGAYVRERIDLARQAKVLAEQDGGVLEVRSMIDVVMNKEVKAGGDAMTMPEEELRDELSLLMLAGEETTRVTELWMLKLLAANPGVQRTLRAELLRVLPSGEERAPTLDELSPSSAPYLNALVHEGLRLVQTAPGTRRQAVRDTTLRGVKSTVHPVKAGTVILLLNGYAARHPPRVSLDKENSEKEGEAEQHDLGSFRPGRWLDGEGSFDASRVWSAAFGGGNRACFGYKTALVFLRFFFATLALEAFVVELPQEMRSDQADEKFTRVPTSNLVGLRRWEDA